MGQAELDWPGCSSPSVVATVEHVSSDSKKMRVSSRSLLKSSGPFTRLSKTLMIGT